MSNETNETKYFDLHITGVGYLNRVREVSPKRSDPFLAADISALSGASNDVQYTRFDSRVVGTEAKRVVRAAMKHVEADKKVLVGFKLGDLYAETFEYKSEKRAGETGISLKTRLLRVDWVKVDGETVYTAPKPEEADKGTESSPASAEADKIVDGLTGTEQAA